MCVHAICCFVPGVIMQLGQTARTQCSRRTGCGGDDVHPATRRKIAPEGPMKRSHTSSGDWKPLVPWVRTQLRSLMWRADPKSAAVVMGKGAYMRSAHARGMVIRRRQ